MKMHPHLQLITLVLLSLSGAQLDSTPSTSGTVARSQKQDTEHEQPDPDFIYATSTFTARHALVNASRAWRAGIRTFVMTNDSKYVEEQKTASAAYYELYAHYVDDTESAGTMRGKMTGKTNRMVVVWMT